MAKNDSVFSREVISAETRKIQLLRTSQACVLLLLLFFLMRAISWEILPRVTSLSLAFVFTLISIFTLWKKQIDITVNLIMIGAAVAATVAVTTSGGLTETAVGWLLLLPCISGLLGGRKICKFWSLIAALILVGLLLGEFVGWQWQDLTPPQYRINQARAHVFMQLLILVVVMLAFLREFERYELRQESHRKILEKEMLKRDEAMAQVKRANMAQTRFMMNISHDLRTPLNSVIGFSKRLLNRPNDLSERDHNAVDAIYRNGKTLLGLVNELLELSNLDARSLHLNWQSINLADVITEVKQEALHRHPQGSINLNALADFQMLGDGQRLAQACLNIINYLYLITPNQTIDLALTIDEGGDNATIAIEDSSKNSSIDEVMSLFRIDGREILNHNISPANSGLGLAIAARLIELHEGEIKLSHTEQGSLKFHLHFASVPLSYAKPLHQAVDI